MTLPHPPQQITSGDHTARRLASLAWVMKYHADYNSITPADARHLASLMEQLSTALFARANAEETHHD